jgi:hypothetical protein
MRGDVTLEWNHNMTSHHLFSGIQDGGKTNNQRKVGFCSLNVYFGQ